MNKLKSLMVAMLLAVPALTFAQSEVTDNDDEFDLTIDNQKSKDNTGKVSTRNGKKTNTEEVKEPVIEEVEVIDDAPSANKAVPVAVVTKVDTVVTTNADDFDNITVQQGDPVIEDVVTTTETPVTSVKAVEPVTTNTNAPIIRNDKIDNIDDVTIPENMFALDSLLSLYTNQTLLTVDEECNLPNYNPQYDESVYIERLSKLPTVMEMPYNDVVRKMIDRYTTKNRRGVSAMLATQNLYMPIFEDALESYGLPLELKYLPIIESGLNPTAVSRAGAAGLWQFMPATAKKHGLEINSLVDERCDPVKSSYAAAKLLYESYKIFGDWNLVIAAYNCGPGNVQKAIHRAGGVYDYWKIYPYLPKETRGYVPAFIAANYIMNYYCEHNICPMLSRMPEQTDTVRVSKDIRMETIAKVLNIPVKEIQELNPQYRQGIINGHSTKDEKGAILRLPSQQIVAFVDNEDKIYNGSSPYKRTTVTPGYSGTDSSYTPVLTNTNAPATKPAAETTRTTAATASAPAKETQRSNSRSRRGKTQSDDQTQTATAAAAPSKYSHKDEAKEKKEKEAAKSSKYDKKNTTKETKDDSKDSSSKSRHGSKKDDSKASKSDKDKKEASKTDNKKDDKYSKADKSKTDNKKDDKSSKADKSKTSKDKKEVSKTDNKKDDKSSKTDKSKTANGKKDSKADTGKTTTKQTKTPKKASATKSTGTASHTVKEGETLSHIAAKNGMTVTELKKKNPNIKGDMIHPGDKVKVK